MPSMVYPLMRADHCAESKQAKIGADVWRYVNQESETGDNKETARYEYGSDVEVSEISISRPACAAEEGSRC